MGLRDDQIYVIIKDTSQEINQQFLFIIPKVDLFKFAW